MTTNLTGFRCYENHPTLELGGGKFIGGSCLNPITEKADIYIGFERGMAVITGDLFIGGPQHIAYPIPDRQAPENVASFKALLEYIKLRLSQGATVHAGCIGGHGRTGTFLAALVSLITGEKDAITWVRKNYCHKAVESVSQVEFLAEHFGITKVEGTDSRWKSPPAPSRKNYPPKSPPPKGTAFELAPPTSTSGLAFKGHTKYDPVLGPRQIARSGIL